MTSKLVLKNPSLLRDTCLVAGEWVAADSGGTIAVDNPSTGAVVGNVPNMGAAETRRAIEFANTALPAWRAKTAKERAIILRCWFELMMANQDDLGAIMTAEQGKPLAEAEGEIAYAASFIEWFGEEGKRVYGDTIPGFSSDRRIVVLKRPIGLCAKLYELIGEGCLDTTTIGRRRLVLVRSLRALLEASPSQSRARSG